MILIIIAIAVLTGIVIGWIMVGVRIGMMKNQLRLKSVDDFKIVAETINTLQTEHLKLVRYADYLAENLDMSISYSEYVAKHVDKLIDDAVTVVDISKAQQEFKAMIRMKRTTDIAEPETVELKDTDEKDESSNINL